MLEKTVKYTNFNGQERTKVCHFHFSEAELTEMELSKQQGMSAVLQEIVDTDDHPKLIEIFKNLVLDSYGEISPDGDRFIKSDEIKLAFSQTNAYNELFMELAFDSKKAADFVNAVIPKIANRNQPELPLDVPQPRQRH